ncbi:DUF1566 domain-containing protein [Leptospira interrogans]|uniref:PF07603 family protein n=2 Tax=Leptospira interrogans TaxID=173 RepID=M3F281_LEPIR|nr:DUF1566 domain-containing protein [Leptospira interrogans]EMF44727.1 PF07603 family protein [Leptospira interrogans serovar Lora str. TE 1992]AKH76550.1 hypothetical protein BRAT_05480 [Leptospira interrogans serovar Bratislava]ALE38535.1 lipoprotein [Leptospira interrogans serovar Hardjo str. Norma]ALN99819.1 hypothetical protein LIH_05555 [Leptospira interrogans serovar Hardjo-prajitno]EKO95444.1 PF07603 family protein [Leptospira interrogans str. Brem 329]
MNVKSAFLFFSIISTSCIVSPPDKPEPPFAILRYFLSPSTNESEEPQVTISNNTPIPVVTPPPNFNLSAVSDTGQTQCWTSGGVATACLNSGQDGEFINTPNSRSFTGPTQHPQYGTDYTTLDNIRGLVWKSCPEGQNGPTCALGAATAMDWDTATNVGGPGSCSDLNNQNGGNGYAGRTNWRIPEFKEFMSLYRYSTNPAHPENVQFPNADMTNLYMTNTTYPLNVAEIWAVDFLTLGLPIQPFVKVGANVFLRCVSGNPLPAFSFLDNGNGTVTDQNTKLLWSKCALGKSNVNCTAGVLFSGNRQSAFNGCNNLNVAVFAGRNNWRLPNANELLSIIDHSGAGNPTIPAAFPNFPPNTTFWTSTTNETTLTESLVINFNGGVLSSLTKTLAASGICVTNL